MVQREVEGTQHVLNRYLTSWSIKPRINCCFHFFLGDIMKSSIYNLYIPVHDKYVVYNTLSGSLIFIDEEMKSALEKNELESLDNTAKTQLQTNGIIIDDTIDEPLKYNYLFTKEMYAPAYSSVTIFPTYACNLSCHYCFQQWSDISKVTMSEKTLKNSIEFLKKKIIEDNSRALLIKVFGGEPLVHPKATKAILAGLHKWTQDQGIRFFGTLTTNGTLFRGDIFEALSPHTHAVHITLDGPEELHNSIRFYSDGSGTYQDIMDSLSLLAETSIRVCLRINIHNHDYKTAASLLKDVKERGFSQCPNFELDFGLIVQQDKCDLRLNMDDYIAGKEIAVKSAQYIQNMLKTVGWEHPENVRYSDDMRMDKAPVLCDQTKRSRYIIDSFGDLYLCPSKAGEKEFCVGHITDNGNCDLNQDFYTILTRNPLQFEECAHCAYLPVCGGGCAIHAKETNGEYTSSFCGAVKDITSKRVISYLKRYYPEKMGLTG
jgi:uncharacterized protein